MLKQKENVIRLKDIDIKTNENNICLTSVSNLPTEIYITFEERFFGQNVCNCFIPLLVGYCMLENKNLIISDHIHVDCKLKNNLDFIQKKLCKWHAGFHPIDVCCSENNAEDRNDAFYEGLFFSLGVDSFHSLLSLPQIDHLLYIHGFDIYPVDHHRETWRKIKNRIQEVSHHFNKECVLITTNMRDLIQHMAWDWIHGCMLASVSLAFDGFLKSNTISSTHPRYSNAKFGTHADLDPYWSTSKMDIIHYGAQTSREAKIYQIIDNPMVQKYLRVCNEQYEPNNCEQCVKCQQLLRHISKKKVPATFPKTIKKNLKFKFIG